MWQDAVSLERDGYTASAKSVRKVADWIMAHFG